MTEDQEKALQELAKDGQEMGDWSAAAQPVAPATPMSESALRLARLYAEELKSLASSVLWEGPHGATMQGADEDFAAFILRVADEMRATHPPAVQPVVPAEPVATFVDQIDADEAAHAWFEAMVPDSKHRAFWSLERKRFARPSEGGAVDVLFCNYRPVAAAIIIRDALNRSLLLRWHVAAPQYPEGIEPPLRPLATHPPAVQPVVPADVVKIAQTFVANGYLGPLHWAAQVFDWVAAAPSAALVAQPEQPLGDAASGPGSLSLRSDDPYRSTPTSEASRDL